MFNVVFDELTKRNMEMSESNEFDNVLCIGYALDIGPIANDESMQDRKEVFDKLEFQFKPSKREIYEFFKGQENDKFRLLKLAETHQSIRIWKSREPHNLCAFAFTCYLLKDKECEISYIDLPEECLSWSLVPSDKYCEFLPLEQKLNLNIKQFYSDMWTRLKNENAKMRAVVNGSIISVDENFYDGFILDSITKEKNIVADVIVTVSNKYRLGIGPYFIALRIMALIEQNKLKLIFFDNLNPFSSVVKK